MNKLNTSVKKYISLLGLVCTLGVSCQNPKTMNEKYEWEEAVSCPPGYPVDVYRGGLEDSQGGFTSLYMGTMTGKGGWGNPGGGMSSGLKRLPDRLHVIWLSYAEDSFYEVNTAIDREKMDSLFRRGYYYPSRDRSRPEPFKEEYNKIAVGFAPGGMVVVWISGAFRQIEIGRYQGKKITIPESESSKLDYPLKNLFNPEYRKNTMTDERIVPKEIQELQKGKPIPYGKWDNYRQRYRWKLSLVLPDKGLSSEFILTYYNGEKEDLFGAILVKKYTIAENLQWDKSQSRSVPKDIDIYWYNGNNEFYTGLITFKEEEIFRAFQEIYGASPEGEAELEVRINQMQTDASVKLSGNGKEVWLTDNTIEMYKIR